MKQKDYPYLYTEEEWKQLRPCRRRGCDFYVGYYDSSVTACGAGIYRACGFRKRGGHGERGTTGEVPT